MIPNPKQTRQVDEDYLAYIKEHVCLITLQRAEPHHTKSRGSGGSDYLTVPLNREMHSECEQIGIDTFQKKHFLSFDKEIIRLLIGYIKRLKK